MSTASLAADKAVRQGLECHRAGNWIEAEPLYRAALDLDQRNSDALHLLGVLYRQTGRLQESLELLTKAAEIAPRLGAIHSNLGNALAQAGRIDEAIAAYRRALDLDPALKEAREGLVRLGSDSGTVRQSPSVLAATLDREYEQGRWAYLARSPFEVARKGVVAAYLHWLAPGGSVIELGCGEATLCRYLGPDLTARYTGVDISEAAIARAREAGLARTLVCSSLEEFVPEEPAAAIVFNEVLYYVPEPIPVLDRYAQWVAAGGGIVVSRFRVPGEAASKESDIWAHLDRLGFKVEDASELHNVERGMTWAIRLYRRAG